MSTIAMLVSWLSVPWLLLGSPAAESEETEPVQAEAPVEGPKKDPNRMLDEEDVERSRAYEEPEPGRVLIGDEEPLGEQKAEQEQSERPTRFGPFILETKNASFQPTFALQIRGLLASRDGQAESQVDVRRHRLGFRARLRDDLVVVRVQFNVWYEAFDLMDLFVDVAPHRWFGFRVGQFTIPYTRYRTSSFTSVVLADWAISTRYFGAERQIGAMIHGQDRGWGYQLGYGSGRNRRASHATGVTRLLGETPDNPSNLLDPDLATTFHPELVLHGFYRSPGMDASGLSDRPGGGLRYAFDISAAYDVRPVEDQDLYIRVAPEIMLKWKHFGWQLAWHQTWHKQPAGRSESGTLIRDPDTGAVAQPAAVRLGPLGPLTELSYRINAYYEVAARYARVQIPDAFSDYARARADELIAAAHPADTELVAAREAQYADVGLLRAQQEVGAGLNIYFVGNSLKLQTDFQWLRSQLRGASPRNDYVGRILLLVAF